MARFFLFLIGFFFFEFFSWAGDAQAIVEKLDVFVFDIPILSKAEREELYGPVTYCRKGAEEGDRESQYNYANILENGLYGCGIDIDRVSKYYGLAAAQGYEKAKAALKALEANRGLDESLCHICMEGKLYYTFDLCRHKVCMAKG